MAISAQTRRLLLNLTLLLLVAGLGALAWWNSSQPQKQPETLLSLTQGDVTEVTITRNPGAGTQDIIRLQRESERWRMLEPKQADANPARIAQLFTLLAEPVDASYDAAGKNLKQYGLEPGSVSVAFNGQSLLFGAENPVSNKRYILTGGKLKLASEAVYGLLTGEALELVSNKLVPEGGKLKSVDLPAGYTAKAETLQNWQSADAIRLEPWDGKGDSQGKITLTLEDGGKVELDLLAREGDLVLGNAALGIRYILPDVQRGNLLPGKERA